MDLPNLHLYNLVFFEDQKFKKPLFILTYLKKKSGVFYPHVKGHTAKLGEWFPLLGNFIEFVFIGFYFFFSRAFFPSFLIQIEQGNLFNFDVIFEN